MSSYKKVLPQPVWLYTLLFLVVVGTVFSYYGVWAWWEMGPVSVHRWRQSDSISQVLCYFENGGGFFNHKVHNLENEGGAAVSEFPILYYISALLYHVFGEQPGILRVLNFLILGMGVYAYGKMNFAITKHVGLGLVAVLAIVGSPIIAFYGFNFLPNTAALGLVLVAFGIYYRFIKKGDKADYWWFIAFNALAGLLKPTLLVPIFAWFGTWLFGTLILKNPKVYLQAYFPNRKMIISGILTVFVTVVSWIFWVRYYNDLHHSVNFLTHIYPIWEISFSEIERIWDLILQKRFTRWFTPFSMVVILGANLWLLFTAKRWHFVVITFFVLLWMGAIAVFLLFYFQFQHHDYYLLDLMYAPLATISFLLFGASQIINKSTWPDSLLHKIRGVSILLPALLFIWCTVNISHAKGHLNRVFSEEHSDMRGFPSIVYNKASELRDYSRSIGLTYDSSKVLVLPDPSFNVTLYYLNLKGFTHPSVALPENKWKSLWEAGVRYVVVFNKVLVSHPDLKKFAGEEIGNYEGKIYFFKMIPPTTPNQ